MLSRRFKLSSFRAADGESSDRLPPDRCGIAEELLVLLRLPLAEFTRVLHGREPGRPGWVRCSLWAPRQPLAEDRRPQARVRPQGNRDQRQRHPYHRTLAYRRVNHCRRAPGSAKEISLRCPWDFRLLIFRAAALRHRPFFRPADSSCAPAPEFPLPSGGSHRNPVRRAAGL